MIFFFFLWISCFSAFMAGKWSTKILFCVHDFPVNILFSLLLGLPLWVYSTCTVWWRIGLNKPFGFCLFLFYFFFPVFVYPPSVMWWNGCTSCNRPGKKINHSFIHSFKNEHFLCTVLFFCWETCALFQRTEDRSLFSMTGNILSKSCGMFFFLN